MTLVVRAIVRAADVERVATGDLIAVRADRVAALASPRTVVPSATEQELRAHDAITRAVHDATPSLPSRFGDVFADERALASALRAREEALAESLDRVGERVETALTLRWRSPRPSPPSASASGRAYLQAAALRAREEREAEQVVARLVEQLAIERAFVRHRICPRDGVAAIVAILSTKDEVATLRRHIKSFGERSSEIVMDMHGPLPPFSFVS